MVDIKVVYYSDAIGIYVNDLEVLYWVIDEWTEDPEVVFSIARAVEEVYDDPEKIIALYTEQYLKG